MKDLYRAEELCDLIANAINPRPLKWPEPVFIRIRPFTGTRTPSPINQRPPDWPRPENNLKHARTGTYIDQMEAMDVSPLINPLDPKRRTPKEHVTPGALISRSDAEKYMKTIGLNLDAIERIEHENGPEPDPTKTKRNPGRPKDSSALTNRLAELETAAKAEAVKQKAAGKTPTVKSVATALSLNGDFCRYSNETLKPEIREAWWK